jgi:hypothetical protein
MSEFVSAPDHDGRISSVGHFFWGVWTSLEFLRLVLNFGSVYRYCLKHIQLGSLKRQSVSLLADHSKTPPKSVHPCAAEGSASPTPCSIRSGKIGIDITEPTPPPPDQDHRSPTIALVRGVRLRSPISSARESEALVEWRSVDGGWRYCETATLIRKRDSREIRIWPE